MNNNKYILHILFTLITFSCIHNFAHSEIGSKQVTLTTNLKIEGEMSANTNRPILLLVSKSGCPYCTRIKREVLEPMLFSGEYAEKIIIREIETNSVNNIQDFDGSVIAASKIMDKFGIKVTPTILFLGPDGKELTERIVGINTLELFSYYVDQAIDNAILKLHSK